MFVPKYKALRRGIVALSLMAALLIGISSCSAVYDDLEECQRGVAMRFVFDYNLEFANSFPSQVDCLTVYIFDAEGNLVKRLTERSSVLQDEDWRMTIDLEPGDYYAVAYGGMECEQSSFAHTKSIEDIKRVDDLEAIVNDSHIGDADNKPTAPLHDHFYGSMDFNVTDANRYESVKMEMKRNTNHLRLVLQHIDNSPVDYKDFNFEVVDDNVFFDHTNDVIPHHQVTYRPWSSGNSFAGVNGSESEDVAEIGQRADAGMPVQVAYAEISMSRLMYNSAYEWKRSDGKTRKGPRLRITNVNDNHVVADLPLNNYLLLMKSDYFSNMDNQEYLDRSYRHNLVFFLDSDNKTWARLNIVVGDWTVRINNMEF